MAKQNVALFDNPYPTSRFGGPQAALSSGQIRHPDPTFSSLHRHRITRSLTALAFSCSIWFWTAILMVIVSFPDQIHSASTDLFTPASQPDHINRWQHYSHRHILQTPISSNDTSATSAAATQAFAPRIGVNWGTFFIKDPPPPKLVVEALKSYGFTRVKLFEKLDEDGTFAIANSGIQVFIHVDPESFPELSGVAASTAQVTRLATPNGLAAAYQWAQEYVQEPRRRGVDIRMVSVGNEPDWKNGNNTRLLPALANVQSALSYLGLDDVVKATIPMQNQVLLNTWPPSAGMFDESIAEIPSFLQLLNDTGAPFAINIYPFFVAYGLETNGQINTPSQLNLETFQAGPEDYLVDPYTNLTYTNMFEAQFDGVVSALTKAGYPNMTIIASESGWPTDGYRLANTELAQLYMRSLVLHLWEGKGTPLRPGYDIETYIFELFDESLKPVNTIAPVEPYWGISTASGNKIKAKYNFSARASAYLESDADTWSSGAPSYWTQRTEGRLLLASVPVVLLLAML